MMSILQDSKECFVTHRRYGLHKHHIYEGPNRRISEQNGFYIWLIPELHNMSNNGIHFNKDFDIKIKRLCQEKFEETHTREEFISLIGRNYL